MIEVYSIAETERMMKLQDVLLKVMAKKITWLEAAPTIGRIERCGDGGIGWLCFMKNSRTRLLAARLRIDI